MLNFLNTVKMSLIFGRSAKSQPPKMRERTHLAVVLLGLCVLDHLHKHLLRHGFGLPSSNGLVTLGGETCGSLYSSWPPPANTGGYVTVFCFGDEPIKPSEIPHLDRCAGRRGANFDKLRLHARTQICIEHRVAVNLGPFDVFVALLLI